LVGIGGTTSGEFVGTMATSMSLDIGEGRVMEGWATFYNSAILETILVVKFFASPAGVEEQ
jgi:hypothetical protein